MKKNFLLLLFVVLLSSCNLTLAAGLILNEYNAVGGSKFLENGGMDSAFGSTVGNGGDWFELVVITDHLNIQGWDLVIASGDGSGLLTFTNNSLWSDLRAGTIITISEDQTQNDSYVPETGDWVINVCTSSGTYISGGNFPVNNNNWQLTIRDSADNVVFGPAGEGYQTASGINSQEVCILTESPSSTITKDSYYDGSVFSTFGLPNPGQSFANLRSWATLTLAFDDSDLYAASGIIDDSTDPLQTTGVGFTIGCPQGYLGNVALNVTPTSNNAFTCTPGGTPGTASRSLIIEPSAVCYNVPVTITASVTINNNVYSQVIRFYYSASLSAATDARYHNGFGDASTVIPIDSDYMLVANDEAIGSNKAPIYLYERNLSSSKINEFDFTSDLGLNSESKEVDIEASTRVGNTIYWMGSHGNGDGGDSKPDRCRLFATTISGTGSSTSLTFAGYYAGLRDKLIAWDVAAGDYYGLYASAAEGIDPKRDDGFNIEGLTMAPDDETAYICFRAPLVGANSDKALIVPITGGAVSGVETYTTFQSWFTNRATADPIFGNPIELDLGGRSIRSIDKNSLNEYLIVAGSPGDTGVAPDDFRLYLWSGNANDAPVLLLDDMTALISEGGSIESIVEVPSSLVGTYGIQFAMDNGTTKWYGSTNQESKLLLPGHQKFRTDWLQADYSCTSTCQMDFDEDGWITSNDYGMLLNFLNQYEEQDYEVQCTYPNCNPCYDLDGDGWITSNDLGMIMNFLNPYESLGYEVQCTPPCTNSCLGDFDEDGWITTNDLGILLVLLNQYEEQGYEISPNDPGWNSCYDLDGDGWITTNDYGILLVILNQYEGQGYEVECGDPSIVYP